MSERIYKLQPDRTIQLRGFDSFAAAAAIHSASFSGFKVSGTFRDPADFAVAVLYDADNFFEHPSIRYLPDFDFRDLKLTFDLRYSSGLQPIDSPKYNWIDWATLDCIRDDGSTEHVRLWDNAMLVGSAFPAASAMCSIVAGPAGAQPFDRVTLWFQNLAFDYIVPEGKSSLEFAMFAGGTGTVHTITVKDRSYAHTETDQAGEDSAFVAQALVALLAGDPDVSASIGSVPHAVKLTVRAARAGISIPVAASDGGGSATLRLTSAELVAADIAAQINGAHWSVANTTHALMASTAGANITLTAARYGEVKVSGTTVQWVSGARFAGIAPGSPFRIDGAEFTVASIESPVRLTLTTPATDAEAAPYTAARGGVDGNLLSLSTLAKTATLQFDQSTVQLAGGASDATWRCTVDFTAQGIDRLRQCWLTFAPALVSGPFPATEWEAEFSNWTLAGPESRRALKVAGPGSIRIEETDRACVFEGVWNVESGFYSKYFAKATSDAAAKLTVTWHCQTQHDLYLGTSLYSDRAVVGVEFDGQPAGTVDCRLATASAVNTRRLVRASVPPGKHTVTFTLAQPGWFYFDFLEAAVPSDVPAALPARTNVSPALDFDTDHTYKLSPARLLWIFDQLGYAGPMNEYLGVFWWNERRPSGGSLSTARIDFTGEFAGGDSVSLTLNGVPLKKTVFPADTPETIASQFAAYINGAFVGSRAVAEGASLTIVARSPSPVYNVQVTVAKTSAAGDVQVTTQPQPGEYATWIVDETAAEPLNRAARDWHADFFRHCAARNRRVATACSLELVNPPEGFAARYPDPARSPVATATGFGTLVSQHCAAGSSKMVAYQKAVYRSIARLQSEAGLTPWVQFGEFLWWYFQGPDGMAFYDDETVAAAQAQLGRPLHVFVSQNDDPLVNGGADARFLRNRLRDHVAELVGEVRAAHPDAVCEVLWPYDVCYPSPLGSGVYTIGGRLNRFVNLPVEWERKSTSGLDAMKIEALAFSTGMRNLDLAREAINLFANFGWPREDVRYLVPVFGYATPWNRELALAKEAGIVECNFWAFDHICLFNLDVPEKALERRSVVKAA